MTNNTKHYVFFTFIRYFSVFVIGILSYFFNVIYSLFLPLTIAPVSFILGNWYDVFVSGRIIFAGDYAIEIVSACVAVSAYFLLLFLNLSVAMPPFKRVLSIIFSFSLLLILNIARIVFFSVLLINSSPYFDILHKLFWYSISIIIVVGIWFFTAFIFKIKNIPVYTDIKRFLKIIKTV